MSTVHLHGRSSEAPPPSVEEVADGVFAYVQLDGSWGLNNAGFVVGTSAVTLVDTCFTVARARALRAALEGVTSQPVRTLVNTHHHGDHTHGNFVFPEATIVGHERCREEVLATGHATQGLFPGVEWGEIELAPPFVTFEDRLSLYVDDRLVELVYVGGPAHTTNDIVAWLPEQRVLFSGDLAFRGGTPFIVMGSLEGSLAAVEALRAFGAETLVPGHGPVCGPEVLDDMAAYLRFVQETARAGFDAGLGPLEAARQADLGAFAEWLDAERLVGNLHRAYSELRGEPLGVRLDLPPVVAEMIEYNGGRPLRCLA